MEIRFTFILNLVVGLMAVAIAAPTSSCHAQSAVLSEIYGRGVHSYHAGQYDKSMEWMSMAIENGFRDPRAYYFRGLAAAASGRGYEAEGDFQQGAELEANGAFGASIGRSLARVQGATRLKLELIRETARLRALATINTRSNARYGELGVTPMGAPAAAGNPAPAARPGARPRAVTPPTPPVADDPFSDDLDQDPVVESNDVLKSAVENSIAGDDAGATATPDAGAADGPFNAGAGSDPFSTDAAGDDDPFGAGAMSDDPFAN